jgi:RND superfamily putative drug exporter
MPRHGGANAVSRHGGREPRPVLLPALLVLAWIAAGVLLSPMLGKLSEAQTNDNTSFLPSNSETTEVSNRAKAFSDKEILPTVVVFGADHKLTAKDQQAIADTRTAVSKVDGLIEKIPPPIPAKDGKAAQLVVPVDGADGAKAGKIAAHVRSVVQAHAPSGVTSYVTGPGGYSADFGEAFAGIDGKLLLITAAIVALILVLVYRSPLLPIVVLCSAGLALLAAAAVIYPLAHNGYLVLNGQTQGILFILVFGAATDYALLLVARYREELKRDQSAADAMRKSLRSCVEPIGASGGTVIAGMLCMLFSELTSNSALGPVAAIGIAASMLASLTFLPAVLMLAGRNVFWPSRPRHHRHEKGARTIYTRIARMVGNKPRRVWVMTTLGLLIAAAFASGLHASGVSQRDVFLNKVDAVSGQDLLAKHFPAGSGTPATIIANEKSAQDVMKKARKVDGIAEVAPQTKNPLDPRSGVQVADGQVQLNATLSEGADSAGAVDTVRALRTAVHSVPHANAQVGGQTASQLDVQDAATNDRSVIIPLVLVVIFLILALLLRALLAPLLLIATVVLSFGATLGVGALVFDHLLDFPNSDPSVPLYAFVFLVALGIDYNIFLMTRVREEAMTVGTKQGTLHGLAVTGGVITSAGVVLAATFAALAVLPILFMLQIAFLVAFGVLLDTIIVRSLLVPALVVDVGRRVWWPSRLTHRG